VDLPLLLLAAVNLLPLRLLLFLVLLLLAACSFLIAPCSLLLPASCFLQLVRWLPPPHRFQLNRQPLLMKSPHRKITAFEPFFSGLN
jgi:hypothetical protein